jgi:hypothetical protein
MSQSVTQNTTLSKRDEELINRLTNVFVALDKLIRGIQLYEGKGALVERLLSDLHKKTKENIVEEVTVKMTPIGPVYLGKPLLEDSQTPKYLFQLFCDGVRELTLKPDIPKEEILGFCDVLNGDYTEVQDDMVTTLWKKEFKFIRYYAVDTLGVESDESTDMIGARQDSQLSSSNAEGEDMTLSSSDIRLLKAEDKLNWVRRCKAPAMASGAVAEVGSKMKESVEKGVNWKKFIAVALRVKSNTQPMIYNMVASLVQQGQTDELIALLNAVQELSSGNISSASTILQNALSLQNLKGMTPLYEKNPTGFFQAFKGVMGLEGYDPSDMVQLLKALSIGPARDELQQLLVDANVDMTPFYLESLENDNPKIICSGLKELGKIGTEEGLLAISKMLTHHLGDIRSTAMDSLQGRYTSSARTALLKGLNDPDMEMRIKALEILANSGEKLVASSLLTSMRETSFNQKNKKEMEKFFEAIVRYPSVAMFGFLREIILEKNITRNKTVLTKQEIVVRVLGTLDNPDAQNILVEASKSWFLPSDIKEAAKVSIKKK